MASKFQVNKLLALIVNGPLPPYICSTDVSACRGYTGQHMPIVVSVGAKETGVAAQVIGGDARPPYHTGVRPPSRPISLSNPESPQDPGILL